MFLNYILIIINSIYVKKKKKLGRLGAELVRIPLAFPWHMNINVLKWSLNNFIWCLI